MGDTSSYIESSLSRRKKGDLVFVSDFRGSGADAAIRKSLSRITAKGKLKRVAHGIYYIPKVDPVIGELVPSAEDIAEKLAKKERVQISPTGLYALNKLGLSTQVPTKLNYLTDGVPRTLTVGRMKIRFKSTTTKKLSMKGEISRLLLLALEEIDMASIEPDRQAKIIDLLQKEDPKKLKHDLSLTTGRIHDYIIKLLKTAAHDRMVATNR